MARIEITDLNEDISITEDEIKHVKGGATSVKYGDITLAVASKIAPSSYKINVQLDANSLGQ